MKNHPLETTESRLVVRGINLWLTTALRSAVISKAERLFRHEPRIIRIRVDLNREHRNGVPIFVARGRIELHGPDLLASVVSADGYKSIDGLIDRLDRMLRRRATTRLRQRVRGDIRSHVAQPSLAMA
jgi:putative sigma-54 modulation protein